MVPGWSTFIYRCVDDQQLAFSACDLNSPGPLLFHMKFLRPVFAVIPGWLISLPFAFISSGYLSQFYPGWCMPVVTLISLTLLGAMCALLWRERPRVMPPAINLLSVSLAVAFSLALIVLCLGY